MSGAQGARESEEAKSERGQGKDTTFYYKQKGKPLQQYK